MVRGVNLVETKEREAPVVSITPASANCSKGVGEVFFEDIRGSVGGRRVEVASYDNWTIVFSIGCIFTQEGERKF